VVVAGPEAAEEPLQVLIESEDLAAAEAAMPEAAVAEVQPREEEQQGGLEGLAKLFGKGACVGSDWRGAYALSTAALSSGMMSSSLDRMIQYDESHFDVYTKSCRYQGMYSF